MAVTRLSHEQITCRAETCFQVSAFTPNVIQEIFCLRDKRIKRCLQKWSYKELLILLLRGRSCLHSLVKESQLVLAYKRPLQQSCFSPASSWESMAAGHQLGHGLVPIPYPAGCR